MDAEPDHRRHRHRRVVVVLVVRLLAEVEVRCDGVLEEVHEEIAAQDQDRRVRREPHALWHELEQDRGQHEARAERHEVTQQAAVPVAARDDQAPDHVRARRDGDARERKQDGPLRHGGGV